MCLTTTQGKAIIATEDITVYKECLLEKNSLKAYCVTGYVYSNRETAPIRIKKHALSDDRYVVSSGLHSYLDDSSLNNTKWIIPKGSRYYKDSSYMVSNKLVFVEFIGNLECLNEDIKNESVKIEWAKPSLIRLYMKWKRYFKADY